MTIILSSLLIVGAIIVSENAFLLLLEFILKLKFLQRNQYLFLPWIILGIMLCIGLLVDVIYTSVVFFIDGWTTSGTLWLVVGLLAVGEFKFCFKSFETIF